MWTREIVETLILQYEQYTCLYVVNDINYKNKMKRKSAVAEITKVINDIHQLKVDTEAVQKKINGLRTTFAIEQKKLNQSKHSGTGRDGLYEPTWWCYNLLKFLNSTAPVINGSSNINSDVVNDEDSVGIESVNEEDLLFDGSMEELNSSQFTEAENLVPTSVQTPTVFTPKSASKRKKLDPQSEFFKESATVLRHIVSNNNCNKDDHISNFIKSMESEIRQIKNKKIVLELKKDISNLIYHALEIDNE